MSENADRHALFLDSDLNQYLPMSLAAFGDASLKLGGRCFDHVVLHPFLTAETTAHCARVVRASAERAGRDPSTVKIWASLVTTGDYLDQELQLRKTVGQLTMYLQLYGNRLAAVNGWNKATLDQILADPIVSWVRALEARGTCQQLEHVASLIPRPWWENTAVGSPANCVATIGRQFQLGCDGVILHGSAPRQLAPIIDCYRHITESAESEPR
jgi:alkanesulfonate monooxygenase SsuD/methylene tetrahydromethanopterin reductase-like flavin-dependent oxidoreductase (luciferase family)